MCDPSEMFGIAEYRESNLGGGVDNLMKYTAAIEGGHAG
jgi:hypothetical protein